MIRQVPHVQYIFALIEPTDYTAPALKNELWSAGKHESSRIALRLTYVSDWILDGGYLPSAVIRIGIRRQLLDRINSIHSTSLEKAYEAKMQYVKALRSRPIAIETSKANEQHYEVGTGVLIAGLGPRMKYSCCLYPTGRETLGQAEVAMLETYVEKAELQDGMRILDLG